MLKARDASIPETCARTPGWLITNAESRWNVVAFHHEEQAPERPEPESGIVQPPDTPNNRAVRPFQSP